MPINKATIMPRGPTLGHASLLPENDRWNETRAQLLAQMDVSMGGRVAEELIFGTDHITTGASSDFDNAIKIAKWMVTKFGMSEKVLVNFNCPHVSNDKCQVLCEGGFSLLIDNIYLPLVPNGFVPAYFN
ncbi:ATP-dependent zinc metalloprotease YME1L1-like [Phyllostomus discolor]|uniref:ATP-dependent zinc metalloprotease YME1L1-like n=1 Tax=Phyllostomus discolor TaxID=89673 RepID=A0A7E6DHN9_9CHIR|nr:ATP-dependent zinc metalloprotease YME1L1-like [Phyllostomus discolor]